MPRTLAFDVYGTLIDPHGVRAELERHIGEEAARFSRIWRERQLEYSFRRAAMGRYRDFSVVTAAALDHACEATGHALDGALREALLERYRTLPAFADALDALATLKARGLALHAFSNGLPGDLDSLMRHAGLDAHLDGTVSVHEVESFKPDPRVYAHFERVTGAAAGDIWLISSNPFDVIGAVACRWRAVWVRRSAAAVFDPWESEPTATVTSLSELDALFAREAGG